jgi:hypothetical protein
MKKLLLVLPMILLFGCATPQPPPPVPEVTFEAPFDKVWAGVVREISDEYPLQVIEKQSGVLQSQMVNIGSGLMTETTLRRYGISPGVLLTTWSSARCSLSVFVKSVDEKHTSVRIRAHLEGFEDNVTKSWQAWPSRAVLEQQLLNKISATL